MAKITELLVKKDNLTLIKTNKYKDITISIKCAFEYDKKLKASLTVLSLMLQDLCEKYPSKKDMAKAKDMLYGLGFDCVTSNTGDLLTLSFTYNFTNPRFFDDVNERNYIDYIEETIKRPLLTDKLLEECKRIVIDSIKRKQDKPSYYATVRFGEIVAKDDKRFDVNSNLKEDDINNLTLNDVLDAYNNLFESRVDIFLIGDYTDELVDYLSSYKSKKDLHCLVKPLDLGDSKEIIEKKDVGQSSLIVSYKTPYVRTSKEYYAFNMGNILFGGIPSSLLFSEVREKDNLCYVIYSKGLRYEGLVYVSTLIDSKNKDKALEEIRKQFKRIVDKDYDPNLLEVAKKMLISNSLSIDDDLDYLISYYYESSLSDTFISIEDYSKMVSNISVDDVSNVFSNYKEYLVYFLEGTLNE